MSHLTISQGEERNASVIYLDPGDRIASMRGKLEAAQGDVIAVVVPRGVSLLRNPFALEFLRRYSARRGREFFIVTKDKVTAAQAREAGFEVLPSLEDVAQGAPEEEETPAPAPEEARPFWLGLKGVILAGSSLGLFGFLLVGVFFLIPSATIILKPNSWIVSETLSITANVRAGSVDHASGQIPARIVESLVETVGRTEARGKRFEPDKPATGQVTFINRSGENVVVPEGTRVGTSTGAQFITKSEVTLPAVPHSTAQVDIEAVEPGTSGNVAELTINQIWGGELALKLSVLNEVATDGGSDKEIRYVTVEDQEKLRQKVREAAKGEGLSQLTQAKKPSEHIYSETVRAELLEEEFEQSVDQVSGWLEMRARFSVTGLAFDLRDVDTYVSKQLAGGEGAGVELMGDSLKTELLDAYDWEDDREYNREDDWVSYHIFAQGRVMPVLDSEAVKRELAGMKEEEAEDYLAQNLQLAERPEVRLAPGWAKSVTRLTWRVSVQVLPGG